ncbi:3-methyladenine DNA glycosylase [Ornithinicoccus halotolerans]|uniref:3-methyladenine DNA glycosylase n=1 Tax=Ornithinicoccus halotolerans TaxID=1748220 RepID=UPI001296C0CB|nr:3-methyladenine DNA glycosylase [Ornithinicoccus halotolerans]
MQTAQVRREQSSERWEPQEWRPLERAHAAAVEQLTADRLRRRREGRAHPVEDFLFDYYHHRPGQLARWHPGLGVRLAGAAERAGWPCYRVEDATAAVDAAEFVRRRGRAVAFVRRLLRATLERPGRFGCFGLHEWAMVYRAGGERRHPSWPLRLGEEGTDAVVEALPLACSHFDATRFFTAEAVPRNRLRPTREGQVAMEQPGCLHAGMDVYRWTFKLAPAVPSELTLRAFRLAREIRELDMRASPYDLTELGYQPVPIETPEGRAEYAAAQRAFSERSNALRRELLAALAPLPEQPATG